MRYVFAWISTLLITGSAFAQELVGQPTPGALGFQPAATRIMERVNDFHNYLLVIIIAISVFVLGLLVWVCIR
ncbi:MAG: cytochrome c oxidase subunit II transmembrane domain-containing protein, partial [Pseudomonadota bacterium]